MSDRVILIECVLGRVAPFFDERDHFSLVIERALSGEILEVEHPIVVDENEAELLNGQKDHIGD